MNIKKRELDERVTELEKRVEALEEHAGIDAEDDPDEDDDEDVTEPLETEPDEGT